MLVNIAPRHSNSPLVLSAVMALSSVLRVIAGTTAVEMLEELIQRANLLGHLEKLEQHETYNIPLVAKQLRKHI